MNTIETQSRKSPIVGFYGLVGGLVLALTLAVGVMVGGFKKMKSNTIIGSMMAFFGLLLFSFAGFLAYQNFFNPNA